MWLSEQANQIAKRVKEISGEAALDFFNSEPGTCSVEKMLACRIRMELEWELGSARVPRAPFGVSPNGKRYRSARRDAGHGNRDGRAPPNCYCCCIPRLSV